jgi:hypothetical protein
MFKVSSNELITITQTLEDAANAINTLERLGSNKHVFLETKQKIHNEIDRLKSRYDLENFAEWKIAREKKKSLRASL